MPLDKYITFASYSIKIKDKHDEKKKLALNELYKKGLEDDIDDFLEVLKLFFDTSDLSIDSTLADKFGKKANRKTFVSTKEKIVSLECSNIDKNKRALYGRVFYGTYGKEHTATDMTDFTEITVGTKTALLQPFYFMFYLPKNEERGIILLERKGNDAIKTTFEDWIKKELFGKYKRLSGYRPIIKGFLPKEVWQKFMKNSDILSFEFEEVGGLRDKENYMNKEFKGVKAKATVSIEIEEGLIGKAKQKVQKVLELTPNEKGYIEFEDKTVQNFKVVLKINNKPKTFYLDGSSFYPYMDLKVSELDFKKGHPKFEIIHEKALEHAEFLLEEL